MGASSRVQMRDRGETALPWLPKNPLHPFVHDSNSAEAVFSSEFHFAFKVEDTRTLQLNAITSEAANHLPTSRRGLESTKLCLAQTIGPVGSQHAMSSTGYRIFGNALRRSEVAADKVELPIPRSAHNYTAAVEPSDRSHIRADCPQNLCAFEHSQIVEDVAEDFDRHNPKSLRQARRRRDPLGSSCRKVHDITGSCPMHREGSAGRVEHHRRASWLQPLHHHRSTGKGGVPAKRNLRRRREPAQSIVPVFAKEKRGLSQVVLGGNRL